MHPHRHHLFTSGILLGLLLGTSVAQADTVVLLPAKGRGSELLGTSRIDKETRLVLVELGHSVVASSDTETAIQALPDGSADSAEEYGFVASQASAAWVVAPTLAAVFGEHRLELVAHHAETARTESVARDVNVDALHQQLSEMAKVLLRQEGVGTQALPWEAGGPPPPLPAPGAPPKQAQSSKEPPQPPDETSKPRLFFVGAGLGVSSALRRPDGASGSSTSLLGSYRAGVQPMEPLEIGLTVRPHMTGPSAVSVDVSGRYLFPVSESPRLRLGPELAPGLFIMRGGAKDKSFMVRVSGIASLHVAPWISLDAQLGDLTWVPASSGSLVLGGATLHGTLRF